MENLSVEIRHYWEISNSSSVQPGSLEARDEGHVVVAPGL